MWGSHQVPLSLQDINGFVYRNLAIPRRSICLAVKRGIVLLVPLDDVVDRSQEHTCNRNNRLLVTAPFLQIQVSAANLGIAFLADGSKGTLDKKRFDVCPGSADARCLFLSGTLVVLRRKTSPRAKMLGASCLRKALHQKAHRFQEAAV